MQWQSGKYNNISPKCSLSFCPFRCGTQSRVKMLLFALSLSPLLESAKNCSHIDQKKIALAKQYVALNKIFSQNFTQRFHSHIHFVFPLLSLAKNCFCKTVRPSNGKRKPPIMKRFWILGCFFLYLKGTEEKDKEEEGGWRSSWSLFSACLPSFFSRVVSLSSYAWVWKIQRWAHFSNLIYPIFKQWKWITLNRDSKPSQRRKSKMTLPAENESFTLILRLLLLLQLYIQWIYMVNKKQYTMNLISMY